MKPFSQACENNKTPILDVIQPLLQDCTKVLEIGSGTGQHAAYFGKKMPHLEWQTSDRQENIEGIKSWIEDVDNVQPPIEIDVLDYQWQLPEFDAVYSANTSHIMSWKAVEKFFAGVGSVLKAGGIFCIYGPFLHNGDYSSASNQQFDQWLKQRDPESAIRDFDALNELAEQAGMQHLARHYLPANNEMLVWSKDINS